MPASWTRQELVVMQMALEEFRTESGPGESELAARVGMVLRGPGDSFAIVPLDEDDGARGAYWCRRCGVYRGDPVCPVCGCETDLT